MLDLNNKRLSRFKTTSDKRSSRVCFTDNMLIEPQFAINNYTKINSSSIINQLSIIDIIWMIDTIIIFVSYVQDWTFMSG